MGKYIVRITKTAQQDLKKIFLSGNKSVIKKVEIIIKEISETPYSGTGKPERLKYFSKNIWSRRINKKDRMVYEVQESEILIIILSALGHYEDK